MNIAIDAEDASVFPASFAQRRLWFIQAMFPNSTAYTMVFQTNLGFVPDIVQLQHALDGLIRRHESLRTAFGLEDGEPVQIIARVARTSIGVIDLRGAGSEWEARFAAHVDALAGAPFDPGCAPLLRVALGITESNSKIGLVLHHLIADAPSLRILVEDLMVLYGAGVNGQVARLPELRVQYADYAVWQRRHLSARRRAALESYWRPKLEGVPALALPEDRPRPRDGRMDGAVHPFAIARPTVERLRGIAAGANTTLFAVLLAGFAVAASRFSDQSRFAVGLPVSGRGLPDLERVVGLFVNSIACAVDVDGDLSFAELTGRIGRSLVDDLEHQDYPFELLVEALGVPRHPDRNPVFQVMFQLQMQADRGPAPGPETDGRDVGEASQFGSLTSQLDLSLIQYGTAEGRIAGGAVFARDLFNHSMIASLIATYLSVLDAAAAAPKTVISAIPLMNRGQREAVLGLGRGPKRDWVGAPFLDVLVRRRAEIAPHDIALVGAGGPLSFAQLTDWAAGFAEELRLAGIGPGRVVAICLPRSAALIAAILGTLEAGGCYVVLDPDSPAQRQAAILVSSGARLVVTPDGTRRPDRIANLSPAAIVPRAGVAVIRSDRSPEDPAYLIYTSGSTGEPKGVAIPHRAIVNHMHWMIGQFAVTREDRILQRTPLTFDAAVWEVFAPLIAGARMVLAPSDRQFDPGRLAQIIAAEGVTVLQVVPSLLRALLSDSGFVECAALTRVCCGGEPLPADLARGFFAVSRAELCNLYGPSETTIDATFHICRRDESRSVTPIGVPIANTAAHVVDAQGRLLPVGVCGELVIGGAAVGLGYLGAGEASQRRFYTDPSLEPGLLFRTGDRVRRSGTGELLFVGRNDEQVKLRGFRIELGEVEALLGGHPLVHAAAAVVQCHAADDQRLVAFVVTGTPALPGLAAELTDWLRERLPGYAVPSRIVCVRSLPLTGHGKIDRTALSRTTPPEPLPTPAADSSALQRRVCRCFARALRLIEVGLDDDFFVLGGHSLLVLKITVALTEELGCRVTIVDVFEFPTPRRLAAAVAERLPRESIM
jgi:amino acid adenylation domain-containing protein